LSFRDTLPAELGQRDPEREALADEERRQRCDEGATETDVAGLDGDALAFDVEDDGNAEVDATRSGDESHLAAYRYPFGEHRR
jgi:hypothetical protein